MPGGERCDRTRLGAVFRGADRGRWTQPRHAARGRRVHRWAAEARARRARVARSDGSPAPGGRARRPDDVRPYRGHAGAEQTLRPRAQSQGQGTALETTQAEAGIVNGPTRGPPTRLGGFTSSSGGATFRLGALANAPPRPIVPLCAGQLARRTARQREPAGLWALSLQPPAVRHQPLPVALPVYSAPALHADCSSRLRRVGWAARKSISRAMAASIRSRDRSVYLCSSAASAFCFHVISESR